MVEQQFASVQEYIESFPDAVQPVLASLRETVLAAVPAGTTESISYHMPTYSLGGKPVVFFAGWKTHVALYAVPVLGEQLESELAPYRAAKDTVRFGLKAPLPRDLVTRVVEAVGAARASG